MVLVSVRGGRKYFGESRLFEDLNFHIDEGKKYALVGANGAGKTSLFKVLSGEMTLDEGEVFINSAACLGYMRQNIEYESEKTVYEEVMAEFSHLKDMETELEEIRLALEKAPSEALIKRQASLMALYENEGGFLYKSKVRGALIGLGFSEKDFDRKFYSLSGGEKTRLLLCRLILGKHRLLLLDEPTNHLDLNSVRWLEGFLKSYPGAFIVISHDRYFLDRVTTDTLGLSSGRITSYSGNYSDFIKKKEADDLAKSKAYELKKKEIKRIEGIIAQQKQWNRERNIKTAESKQKMIDRIASEMEKPEEAQAAINFSFKVMEGGANEVIKVSSIKKSFGNKAVLSGADMTVYRGERVFLLGDNGCGKTTLLKTILGKEKPDSGTIKIGNGIYIGYYEQQHVSLDASKTVFDEIADAYPKMDRTSIRSALAAFLFRGEDCFKLISSLSGGEKARVLLCKIMLSESNLLVLDEPTNHLDIFSKEALEDALKCYTGTILAVSHDRYFINALADKIYKMEDGVLKCYDGNYDYYLEKSQSEESAFAIGAGAVKEKKNDYLRKKEEAAAKRKAQSRLEKAEAAIAEAEKRISELDELLFSEEGKDIKKAIEWTEEREALSERLNALYNTWEESYSELSKIT